MRIEQSAITPARWTKAKKGGLKRDVGYATPPAIKTRPRSGYWGRLLTKASKTKRGVRHMLTSQPKITPSGVFYYHKKGANKWKSPPNHRWAKV
jgi:hypothetical protein